MKLNVLKLMEIMDFMEYHINTDFHEDDQFRGKCHDSEISKVGPYHWYQQQSEYIKLSLHQSAVHNISDKPNSQQK